MRRIVSGLLVVLAVALATSVARPCGALFPSRIDQNLALDAQRALVVVREATIEMHLQMRAATDGAGFAWVLPVAGDPTLALGDAKVFDALDALTTPTVELSSGDSGGGGFGCGSAADAKGGGDGRQNGVQHFGGGVLGDYTYDIIAGTSASAIETWLDDHGYLVADGFAAAIAPYAGKMSFVAVRLDPKAALETDLTPLVVTVPRSFATTITYPLALAKLSTDDLAPVVLWVLADKRYRVANFGSAELQAVANAMRAALQRDEPAEYDAAVNRLTDEAGGRLAVTEFAGELDDTSLAAALGALRDDDAHYLTRIYLSVPKEALEDLVITFAANAPDVEPRATADAGGAVPMTAACVALAIIGVAIRRRRN